TMSDNTTPSGTVSSDDSDVDAWRVFARELDMSAWFAGSVAGWLAYDFAGSATYVVDGYWLKAHPRFPNAMPGRWKFQGYTGSAWVTLDTKISENAWQPSETRFCSFQNETAYSAYRLL